MSKARLPFALLLCAVIAAGYFTYQDSRTDSGLVVFASAQPGCPIILPRSASGEEMAAARLIQRTLALAAGRTAVDFPIVRESRWRFWQRGLFVGRTGPGQALPLSPVAALAARQIGYATVPGGAAVRSADPGEISVAAAWFLERELGAHWFMPGPLGESVPRREALALPPGQRAITAPSYHSRDFSGLGRMEEKEWMIANKLSATVPHRHSMMEFFTAEDLFTQSELAPLINWQRHAPKPGTGDWQPNLIAPEAVSHVARQLARRFAAGEAVVPLAVNDSYRYDQARDTLAVVAPPRFFRDRPDYSDLVFGFLNRVAEQTARANPGHSVSTYAYYWAENAPRFPVRPEVLPFLTADRSQWFDPGFAAEDQALIRRWTQAGPRLTGLYDYYYGAPFLVPRPTLYAVAKPVGFAHGAGVRVFFAEAHPNWALDGPKLWLAAQLLWDVQPDPARLLDTYYREFWQEAARPMREFFELCDEQWLKQPRPAYWLKYYKDEHQYLLYPAAARRALRQRLEAAAAAARTPAVRERVEFVSAAFAASESFVAFCELRESLSRLVLDPAPDSRQLALAAQRYLQARASLPGVFAKLQSRHPLALGGGLPGEYLRNEPLGAVVGRLASADPEMLTKLAADSPAVAAIMSPRAAPAGRELTRDGSLQTVRLTHQFDSATLNWTMAGLWQGYGEPSEHRKVSLVQGAGRTALRWEGCKQETLAQWHAAEPGALYAAAAQVRAKVSPGNHTFLLVIFLDGAGKYLGLGQTLRLPPGDWSMGTELAVRVRAPAAAKQVGFGVRVLNQVNDDFAEFEQLRLEQLE